jgi:predicted nucleic acid-binding protein
LNTVIADASALVDYVLGIGRSDSFAAIIRNSDTDLHVPALCDIEFASGLRSALKRRLLSEDEAVVLLADYLDLPLTRHGHQTLLLRTLELRENLTAYDATYVGLAEQLNGALLTADESLARAARAHTGLTVLP